jgi:hypothetical protein
LRTLMFGRRNFDRLVSWKSFLCALYQHYLGFQMRWGMPGCMGEMTSVILLYSHLQCLFTARSPCRSTLYSKQPATQMSSMKVGGMFSNLEPLWGWHFGRSKRQTILDAFGEITEITCPTMVPEL